LYFESLDIRGFGRLKTKVEFAKNKLNLVIADNEAGKSTLVDALLAAFYGIEMDNRKTSVKRPHYKHVQPWSNPDEFGLILNFVADGVPWRIERDFNSNSVKMIDRDSGKDLSSRYHKGRGVYRIGEELIGLSCSDFIKSFYLKQEDAAYMSKAGGLTSHVQKAASVANEGITSDHAIERLQQALLKCPLSPTPSSLNIDNTIKRLSSERDRLDDEIRSLDRRRSEIEPDCVRMSEIEANLTAANDDKEKHIHLMDRTELIELTIQLNNQAELRNKIDQLTERSSRLEEYAGFPEDKWEQLISLTTSYKEISHTATKLDEDINRVVEPLNELETESESYNDLQQITEQDLHEFEAAVSRLEDRRNRFITIRKEADQLSDQIQNEGYNKDEHENRKEIFQKLDHDEPQFIDEYSRKTEEEEQTYRTSRAARGAQQERRDRSLTANKHKRNTSKIVLIVAAAFAIAAGITLILSHGAWYGLLLGGICIITSAAGFMLRSFAMTPKSSEISTAEMELAVAVSKENEVQKKLEIMRGELEQIAETLGFSDGNELLNEYAEYKRIEEISEPLQRKEHDLEIALEYAMDAIKLVHPFFEKAGKELPKGADAVKTTQDLLERCRCSVSLSKKCLDLLSRKDRMSKDMTALQADKVANHQDIINILKLAGIDANQPPDDAVHAFRNALNNYRQYISITEEQLPRLNVELIPETNLSTKENRLTQLQNKLKGIDDADNQDHSMEFYREKVEKASEEIDSLNDERIEVSRRISAVYDQYQATYPGLIGKKEELDENIRRAESFHDEIELSISIMKDISHQVYGSWAAALSQETAPLLEALNPAYTDIRFNDDLSFTITDNRQGRSISSKELDTILSSGARDEVSLAARLGIARYLSRNSKETIPIVLDEPLATADDERFLNGMQFFLDPLSTSHQVLIMSCHEQRHLWLKKQLQELFKKKVHIVNIGSG